MRRLCLLVALLAAASAHAAKPGPALYPNANIYLEPASRQVPGNVAKLVREYCPGQGRGLIHFFGLDGTPIRIRGTWPTYLELAPGPRTLEMEFIGTDSSIYRRWTGKHAVQANLEAGKAYLVRYRRAATDLFTVWIEPLEDAASVGPATTLCLQPAYPDPRLHL
jgi:hypothetical protein